MRSIKDVEELSKEELIITLLKSEGSAEGLNFNKVFNNNTNDDTYDYKIGGKISNIRMTLSRLENIVDINCKNKIRK